MEHGLMSPVDHIWFRQNSCARGPGKLTSALFLLGSLLRLLAFPQVIIKLIDWESDEFSDTNKLSRSTVTSEASRYVGISCIIWVHIFSQRFYIYTSEPQETVNYHSFSWICAWFMCLIFILHSGLEAPFLHTSYIFLSSKVFTAKVDRAVAPLMLVLLSRIFGISNDF